MGERSHSRSRIGHALKDAQQDRALLATLGLPNVSIPVRSMVFIKLCIVLRCIYYYTLGRDDAIK